MTKSLSKLFYMGTIWRPYKLCKLNEVLKLLNWVVNCQMDLSEQLWTRGNENAHSFNISIFKFSNHALYVKGALLIVVISYGKTLILNKEFIQKISWQVKECLECALAWGSKNESSNSWPLIRSALFYKGWIISKTKSFQIA